jgi:hypothetical protein
VPGWSAGLDFVIRMEKKKDAEIVILRLNEEQKRTIRKLKKLTNQRAASKAVFKAVDGYMLALSRLKKLEEAFDKISRSSYSGSGDVRQLQTELLS